MKAGDQVRVVRGMHGGREGVVTSSYVGIAGGSVVEVRLVVPQLITVPDGPTAEVVLPYAPVELELVAS